MKASSLTSTELGTAYHNFMQHVNFDETLTQPYLSQLRNWLIEHEILSEVAAMKLDLNLIERFKMTALYEKIKKAPVRKTEVPFMMLVSDLVYQEADVLLQGVVDLLIEDETTVLIVDYKSDYVRDFNQQKEELTHRYHVQMHYYLEAIKKMYPNKIVSCAVHYLNVNETIYYSE